MFKFRRAEYLACTNDYDMISEGEKIITQLKIDMGESFRMLFVNFPAENLMK